MESALIYPFMGNEGQDVEDYASYDSQTTPTRPSVTAREKDARRDRRRQRRCEAVVEASKRVAFDVGRSGTGKCIAFGCRQIVRAATSNGLDRRLCRPHADFLSRHGSLYRRTYTKAEIDPFRSVARRWLTQHRNDRYVEVCRARVQKLMNHAGRPIAANSLRGLTPEERAKALWARLREADTAPDRIMVEWLAVHLAVAHMPPGGRDGEFRQVQTAKVLHRLVSGYHRKWAHEEMHVWPHSRGRVLRHVGTALDKAMDWLLGYDPESIMREVEMTDTSRKAAQADAA